MFKSTNKFFSLKSFYIFSSLCATLTLPTFAQHHYNNWIHRNATDTTITVCRDDSLTFAMFPPGSMMGMMFPDSIYCRIDRMQLDSLNHPHDSTFIGWHKLVIGRDSAHYNMMNDSMMSKNHTMQFMSTLKCQLHWDSLYSDSAHRGWEPAGVRGWDGTQWVNLTNVSFEGKNATFETSQLYATIAFVGSPPEVTGISSTISIPTKLRLEQNYPNPFNPSTKIRFILSTSNNVELKVYNILGNEVATIIDNQYMDEGVHDIRMDATNLSSGIYFYTLKAGRVESTQKMILVR
jgi:hypothetical protein